MFYDKDDNEYIPLKISILDVLGYYNIFEDTVTALEKIKIQALEKIKIKQLILFQMKIPNAIVEYYYKYNMFTIVIKIKIQLKMMIIIIKYFYNSVDIPIFPIINNFMMFLILQILSQKVNLKKNLMKIQCNDIKNYILITKKPNNMYQLYIIRLFIYVIL